MLNNNEIFSQSIFVNLYYLRTLRGFCLDVELTSPIINEYYINIAKNFATQIENLGQKVINLAQGNILKEILDSQIFVTDYTLFCEKLTEKFFGVDINTTLTEQELSFTPGESPVITNDTIIKVQEINNQALLIAKNIITFFNEINENLDKNEIFMFLYPSFFTYALEGINIYIEDLERIINKESFSPVYAIGYEYYFNDSLQKTAEFIRGWTDPEHEDIIDTASYYVNAFEKLAEQYLKISPAPDILEELNNKTLDLINKYTIFVKNLLDNLLNTTIHFIIPPITLDIIYTKCHFCIYVLNKTLT